MSFMFNPHPYDDPTAINKLNPGSETVSSIVSGTKESAAFLTELLIKKLDANNGKNVIIALDGYASAQFDQTVNLISQNMGMKSVKVTVISFYDVYKSTAELDVQFSENLPLDREKDPVLLYGKLFKGTYDDLMDAHKIEALEKKLTSIKNDKNGNEIFIVFGCGCASKRVRSLYDYILFFDVTPKKAILRAKGGLYTNLGDSVARPVKTMLRRCYYIDFEVAGHLRWELFRTNAIDFYVSSDDPENIKLIPYKSFNTIMSALAKQPFRCRPVYIEGVWGGHYVTKLRHLPDTMKNCAWVFDLIPLEVSIVAEVGDLMLEFPYFTFVQKEGEALMGAECVKKFHGYFPIRFNYDDTFHSSGNMSIQVHSGHQYNVENYGEYGRQDESYYIVATGHDAKTYVGFTETADPKEFIQLTKKSEKDYTPIDYEKYINYVKSEPGIQVILPAGTIHSSGRNQVILEIGSLTIGSYTYKMYDYLRADLDGKPRPIHTFHGENVLATERNTSWVNDNIVQKPQLVKSGDGWAEYIVGEHDLVYFSLRRLEFEKTIEGNTEGKFHVLTLIDGEKVRIESLDNPELNYTQNYLDVVVVPANMGRYIVRNLGNQPVCIHKTMLKDGFINDRP
ncbi:MAG: phosphoheptose isomerase [Bacteroidetes bacterium GWF2_40_14]|nr:MAG: phosphoheptose isomerase [Bacteroidetes bacterium GWF2_40_14]